MKADLLALESRLHHLSDWTELLEREGRIERAQRNAYYEIGLDLKEIRDKRLLQGAAAIACQWALFV